MTKPLECSTGTIILASGEQIKAFRVACKCWDCDQCRPIRLWQLARLAEAGSPVSMITLTASPQNYQSPDEMARAIVRGWRNVIQRGTREGLFTRPAYLCVFEEHQSGWPHLHILWRGPYVPQEWLSQRMAEYADGPNVWINTLASGEAAAEYVAKYISKGPARYSGCKRYWRSLNWLSEQQKQLAEDMKWWSAAVYNNEHIAHVHWILRNSGWQVEVDDDEVLTAYPLPHANWSHHWGPPPEGIPYTDYAALVGHPERWLVDYP